MISFAAVSTRIGTTFPEADQDSLQQDCQNKERRPDEENAGVSDRPRADIGKEWSDQGTRGSARRDYRE